MPFRSSVYASAALAAMLVAGIAAAAPAALSVRLPTSASVTRQAVVLGDLADVEGADREQAERLRTLPLGRIDAGAKTVRLQRADIARWACMKRGLCAPQVAWSGAERVDVSAAVRSVAGTGPTEAGREELERALAPLGARLSIEAADPSRGVELPPGDANFRARPLPAGTAPGPRMSVWIDAYVNGRFVRAVPVRFKVAAMVPAWVAKNEIPAGARVDASAFLPGEADLAELAGFRPRRRSETFTAGGESLRMRYALHPGQVLTVANSGPVPLVARGESALLRVKSSPIELESRVEVLQDGFLGQTVRVKTRNAAGTLLAKVAGAGQLEAQN